jgi:hypothetical protein
MYICMTYSTFYSHSITLVHRMHVNMYVLVYETRGLEVKLCIFLTVPVLNSHFTALATLIADKQVPGTETIIGGLQTSL